MRPLHLVIKRISWGSYSEKPGWMLSGIREDGKIKRRFFKDREAAEREKARLLRYGDLAHKLKPEKAAEAAECFELLARFGKGIREATEFYLKYLEWMKRTVPISELIAKYIAAKTVLGRSGPHLTDLRYRLRAFEEKFGEQPTSAITTRDVSEWLLNLNVGPRSQINYRRVLHALFNFAVAQRYAGENPIKPVEKPNAAGEEPGVLKPEALKRLLDVADERIRPALAIAGFAGLRPAEVQRLTWEKLNLPERLITVSAKTAKTASRRVVPISDNLLAWLMRSPTKTGPVALPFNTHRKLMMAARDAAKIKDWPTNALRHSWVSYRLALTGNAALTAFEAGHDEEMLHEHYKALATHAEAERWFAIMPGGEAVPKPVPFEAKAAQ